MYRFFEKNIKPLNLISIERFLLLCSIFFLPINFKINNYFLGLFVILSFWKIIKTKLYKNVLINKNKQYCFFLTLPFLLNVGGLFYTEELSKGLDEAVRMLPFLILPIITLFDPKVFRHNFNKIGGALVMGCLFVALFCWSSTLIRFFNSDDTFTALFGPLYANKGLTAALNLHPVYMSICLYTAIGFLIVGYKKSDVKSKIKRLVLVVLLSLFMGHLLSRNALVFYLISSAVYTIYNKKWRWLLLGASGSAILLFLAFNVKHNYLRDRLFYNFNFFEKETKFSKKDDRFDRLAASFQIFKDSPIYGYGTAGDDYYRTMEFKKNRDMVAYHNRYNAHNQFMEYLSTFGLIGAFVFLWYFTTLFKIAYGVREGFFWYVLAGLFCACLTESIFQRTTGIVYVNIIAALMLSYYYLPVNKKE